MIVIVLLLVLISRFPLLLCNVMSLFFEMIEFRYDLLYFNKLIINLDSLFDIIK
jgi:hypothetical protein